MMTIAVRTLLAALALIGVLGLPGASPAQTPEQTPEQTPAQTPTQTPARPLLVEGKSATYQRVLTKPGARLLTGPGAAEGTDYPPFQPLYVYGRQGDWVQVGPAISSGPSGWVALAQVVEWRQNIVAAFTNPAGRKRQLIFDSQEKLEAVMGSEDVMALEADLLAQSDTGHVDPASGVLAVEPEEFINIRDQLYLMPILSFAEGFHPLNNMPDLLMETASIPLSKAPAAQAPAKPFDAGIVFVLDTTKSMGPYIERTRAAVERIVTRIGGTDLGSRVQFGVVGFRDDPSGDPAGIEYRTRILAPLARRAEQTQVLQAIQEASAVASVSTPGFNEDSMAGVEDAIDAIDWAPGGKGFDGKYVILVTDAGPDDPNDPHARSRIGPAELQVEAEEKGIAILTLHLKTPAGGAAQHDYARGAYQALSVFSGGSFYYPIENGDEATFAGTIDRMVAELTDTIRVTMGKAPEVAPEPGDARIALLGRAMQLAWLGGQPGAQPPDLLRGWVSDLAISDPDRLAVEPRLLVTKNEMATMADLLQGLVEAGEETRDAEGADAFFTQVQGVIARMAQDPNRLMDAAAQTPGEALEFLQDLPYRSQILSIDQQTWGQSATRRRQILDGMRQKLVQYRKWLLDPAVWTALYQGSPDGETVYAMPFDVLP